MAVDPDVIAALEAVVARDPKNLALQLHLATLQLEAGNPAEALRWSRSVLQAAPADPTALELEERARAATASRPRHGLRLLRGDG